MLAEEIKKLQMRGVEVTTEISYIDEMNNLKDGRVSQ